MKALTVRQPWAWAIISGQKDVENRSRDREVQQRWVQRVVLCLCSRESRVARGRFRRSCELPSPLVAYEGAALGIVDLTDSHQWSACLGGLGNADALCSRWAQGNLHHLVLADARPFPEPIMYRGRLGLWEFPDELIPGGAA